MLNTVHHDHLERNGKSLSTDESRLKRTMATSTAAYREKKNCSGLSVMVLNVFDITEEPGSIPSVCTILSHLASSITASRDRWVWRSVKVDFTKCTHFSPEIQIATVEVQRDMTLLGGYSMRATTCTMKEPRGNATSSEARHGRYY